MRPRSSSAARLDRIEELPFVFPLANFQTGEADMNIQNIVSVMNKDETATIDAENLKLFKIGYADRRELADRTYEYRLSLKGKRALHR
jgi:hypothetical protein